MALKNTRFALGGDNKTIAATLINGASSVTYPSRPALSEDAQYPMSNLRINDRSAAWRSATALTGTYDVEWDLGADYSLDVFAVHGFRRAIGQASPNTVDIQYRTAALGYLATTSWATVRTGLALGSAAAFSHLRRDSEIGRASCRERV